MTLFLVNLASYIFILYNLFIRIVLLGHIILGAHFGYKAFGLFSGPEYNH